MGANLSSDHGIRRRGQRRRSRPMAEINVTPFVDVMLVLLIVFMVSAPMLTVGVPVELPKTTANALPTEPEEPLTITLTASGQIFIQKSETPPDQLLNNYVLFLRNAVGIEFSCGRTGRLHMKRWCR